MPLASIVSCAESAKVVCLYLAFQHYVLTVFTVLYYNANIKQTGDPACIVLDFHSSTP